MTVIGPPSNVWVNECRVVRLESIFNQYLESFLVDIVVGVKIQIEEVITGHNYQKRGCSVTFAARLRYCFDLRPCHLSYWFNKVITDEERSLLKLPGVLIADKYLLPVQKSSDYARLADTILRVYYLEIYGKDEPVDPKLWL